jgi:hypothetical protein
VVQGGFVGMTDGGGRKRAREIHELEIMEAPRKSRVERKSGSSGGQRTGEMLSGMRRHEAVAIPATCEPVAGVEVSVRTRPDRTIQKMEADSRCVGGYSGVAWRKRKHWS